MIDSGQAGAFTSGDRSGRVLRRCNERLFALVREARRRAQFQPCRRARRKPGRSPVRRRHRRVLINNPSREPVRDRCSGRHRPALHRCNQGTAMCGNSFVNHAMFIEASLFRRQLTPLCSGARTEVRARISLHGQASRIRVRGFCWGEIMGSIGRGPVFRHSGPVGQGGYAL